MSYNLREEYNGPRTVHHGIIVMHSIDAWTEALFYKAKYQEIYPESEIEITGVAGDYKIIKRSKQATTSEYL